MASQRSQARHKGLWEKYVAQFIKKYDLNELGKLKRGAFVVVRAQFVVRDAFVIVDGQPVETGGIVLGGSGGDLTISIRLDENLVLGYHIIEIWSSGGTFLAARIAFEL